MPYASKAQQRFFHAAEARGDMPAKTVNEFDQATNFKKLPEKVKRARGGEMYSRGGFAGALRRKMAHGGQAPDGDEMYRRMFGGGIATDYRGDAGEAEMRDGTGSSFEKFSQGGIATGYEGEAEEASYREGQEFPEERFAEGGMVCPNCGEPIGREGGPGERVSAMGPTGGEEGPDRYATHGPSDPHSPRESFGRALRKKFGHHGM